MRQGNFFWELVLSAPVIPIHRGVSQGGKNLSPQSRLEWWKKNSKPLPEGLEITEPMEGRCIVRVSRSGLQTMRRKALVLATQPAHPWYLTPTRILRKGQKRSRGNVL